MNCNQDPTNSNNLRLHRGSHAPIEKKRYNAEIVAGSLVLAESRKIAELLLEGIGDGA